MEHNELYHHGIKGQRWGVRRFQNKDGSLTQAGKKKYRKDYNDVKSEQILSERSKTVNSLKSNNKSINSFVDNYNADYYNKRARNKMNLLLKRIGDKGVSELDSDVINEGKRIANEIKNKAEIFNKSIDLSIDDNYLFLKNPQEEYDRAYKKYLDNNLVRR